MKRLITLLSLSLILVSASDQKKIPANVEIQTLQGQKIKTSSLKHDGPMVISFWATWCKPCVQELQAISESYEDLQDDYNFKLVAVSIDDQRNVRRVPGFVSSKGWEYDVYCDPNGDFKRAMNVNTVPHTFLADAKGNIVWSHNRYSPGDEEILMENIAKLHRGESLGE